MRRIIATIGLIALGACDQQQAMTYADESMVVDLVAAPAMVSMTSPAQGGAGSGPQDQGQTPPRPQTVPQTVPQMAYVYNYSLELPSDRTGQVMAAHEQACVKAGPNVCQVVASSTAQAGRDASSARLELRAAPVWIARFRAGVAEQARTAGGKVASASTTGEDLTLTLTDTEARLKAQTTLRDRLQQLLSSRSGDLGDLLKVESELARVQGEIDSVQSSLAVLRTRVATSRLQIDYQSAGQLAADSSFAPVQRALNGALGAFMATVGVLITVLAVAAPLALVIVPIIWLVLRQRRRRAALKVKRNPPPTDPTI